MYVSVALVLAAVFGHGAFAGSAHKSLIFLTRAWIWPSGFDFAIMVALGVVGAALMPLFVMSYRGADASFVAPFEYTAMFWAVLWGVIGFGDVPDLQMASGAAVVVAAGLFMLKMDARYRA
jgi:S-adenosylmethionine uptake transporter